MCHLEHFLHFMILMIFKEALILFFKNSKCFLKLRFLSNQIPKYLYDSTIGMEESLWNCPASLTFFKDPFQLFRLFPAIFSLLRIV